MSRIIVSPVQSSLCSMPPVTLTPSPTHKHACPSVFSFSDDGEDGAETSDRESPGKKKRGPKKKKETKKKEKEGKTTKARKRKKLVSRSISNITFFNKFHLKLCFHHFNLSLVRSKLNTFVS